MNRLLLIPSLALLLLTGCPQPTEQTVRDSIAAAHGLIITAQGTWGDSCRANNTQPKCVATNKLIAAQRTAADALGVYCSGTPLAGQPSYAAGGVCVPQKNALGALQAALNSLNSIVTDVNSLLSRS